MEDITDDEVQALRADRAAFRVPIIDASDTFRFDEVRAIITAAERAKPIIIVETPELLQHKRIEPATASQTNAYLHSLHLDTLPYATVLLIVPVDERAALRAIIDASGLAFEELS